MSSILTISNLSQTKLTGLSKKEKFFFLNCFTSVDHSELYQL